MPPHRRYFGSGHHPTTAAKVALAHIDLCDKRKKFHIFHTILHIADSARRDTCGTAPGKTRGQF